MEILIINKNQKTILNWKHKNIKQKCDDSLNEITNKISKSKIAKGSFIFVLANMMYSQAKASSLGQDAQEVANSKALVDTTTKLTHAGNAIFGIVQTVGYWLILIMCIIEILKCLMQGDTKSIAKVMMKFGLAYASFYLFPWILDLIRTVFS